MQYFFYLRLLQSMSSRERAFPRTTTSVEIITFNMNKNPLALGEVLSCVRKESDLIIICLQESDLRLENCKRKICSFFENYECKDEVEHGVRFIACVQMFVLQHKKVCETFTFSHESMPFSFSIQNPLSYRPWKGAVFLKCNSQKFCRPFVFVGAHFHAHEGEKNVKLRQADFNQVQTFLCEYYTQCDWSLFGDLNFRSSANTPDEFQRYLDNKQAIEHDFGGSHTYKVDVRHRNQFDAARMRSRTDRVCHNNTADVEIDDYGIVKTPVARDTVAGAGSDHYPVFETFRIMHKPAATLSPSVFLVAESAPTAARENYGVSGVPVGST